MKLRILGCGTSSGVPRIGTEWGDCDPAEPRNRRRRVSILVEYEGTRILVDTSPDLREQLLDADVAHLDGVIWTHDHADHCHGIDDLRAVFHVRGNALPGYARPETLASLTARFTYAFAGIGGYPPMLDGRDLGDCIDIGGIAVRAVDQPHGDILSTGLRFEAAGVAIGYSTDCNVLTDEMRDLFEGVDAWIVGALRRQPHPSHASLAEALEWISAIRPKRAILTHMDHSMDYARLVAELPPGIEPGYDGLEILL
ncbi:MBL fold metallo-hydrolase [Allosphingosinicella indica]|uniref:Phosphoribosyl 1,2-cyclic phosphate phosphodiesterase n=1 Tax=Allosphingosinicella indica TaxID=941907 RepID=A0A1X7H057_9SPHN|nr:MBL fold metallo-hydrolase [Allosphingosinicella indica]SMF76674.1 phosphoribosyl 1,2-cyclic phosphate phosphodiesterase [Allosphingosinicella indica]